MNLTSWLRRCFPKPSYIIFYREGDDEKRTYVYVGLDGSWDLTQDVRKAHHFESWEAARAYITEYHGMLATRCIIIEAKK